MASVPRKVIVTTRERELASKCFAGWRLTADDTVKNALKNEKDFISLALDLTLYGSQILDLDSSQPDEFKKINALVPKVTEGIKQLRSLQDLLPMLRDFRKACKPALKAYKIN